MTYAEIMEIAGSLFDEYLPKVSQKSRKAFMDGLLDELESDGCLTVDEADRDEESASEYDV